MRKGLLSLLTLGLLSTALFAQTSGVQLALQHVLAKADTEAYTVEDLRDLGVDYSYTDEKVGVTYVYLQQHVGTLPIRNAMATVALKDGQVVHVAERLVDGVAERLTSVVPKLDDKGAMEAAAASLGERMPSFTARAEEPVGPQGQRLYAAPDFAHHNIAVEDYYLLTEAGQLVRAFGVSIDHRGTSKAYRISVDANSGQVLETEQQTVECSFGHGFLAKQVAGDCDEVPARVFEASTTSAAVNDGSSYRVFAWPAESPSHGPHVLVPSPADSEASPFGWHDTDGAVGPEFTITRGNNTHAYIDDQDTDSPSEPEPDGGADLVFDFPFDEALEPDLQTATTVTNLFYAVNQMHDFTFNYGFDEAAGNFQQTNYSSEGRGGDAVQSQSQDGGAISNGDPDGDHVNNANFFTPADGSSGRMQMYLWDANNSGNALSVVSPAGATSTQFPIISSFGAGWGVGAFVNEDTDITAGVADVDDGIANTQRTDGCEDLINVSELAGKIALVDRGSCEFGSKALRAQEAGAVAVIICNFEEDAFAGGGGADGPAVQIPAFMLSLSGCTTIRELADEFDDFALNISLPDELPTTYVSGSLDNGIVAHEFGHGVSTRLTGGPNVSCLNSEEQMGEGWSDFFSLVTSTFPGDDGAMRRGIGTYAQREPTSGGGIRNYPYSTDLSVNPVTYDDVANNDFSAPHGVGSIWCSMLWDLYWAMVEEYGFDADQFHGDGGNNRAIRLVMEGMKLQPCGPGFVDGRDAILAADRALYGGENQKLIWEVFAGRGLGVDADQGDPNDRYDGASGFTIPAEIADDAFFTKSVTEETTAGGTVEVQLLYANWLETPVLEASITDELPAGASLNAGSVSDAYVLDGDVITFEFANIAKGDTVIVTYSYQAPTAEPTVSYFQPFADTDEEGDWDSENPLEDQSDEPVFWEMIEDDGYNDDISWFVPGTTDGSAPYLAMPVEKAVTISGANPVFSFFTKYQLDAAAEGGIIEVYNANEDKWDAIPGERYLRNGASVDLPYQTFVIPFLEGFAGQRDEWERVLIDMSDYSGQTVQLRWRYGRDDNATGTPAGRGWHLDAFEFFDAITYNTQATLTTGVIEPITISAADVGTFITPDTGVDVVDVNGAAGTLRAFPNPTHDEVTFFWDGAGTDAAGLIELYSATGQRVRTLAVGAGDARRTVSLEALSAGLYTARVVRGGAEQTLRIVKQ